MKKSNEKSVNYRNQGNEFYKNRSFLNAMIRYNRSLGFAENGSENLGLSYANRSAVYLEMKLFDHCLSNIELALENHYPEKNYDILNKRRAKCIDLMGKRNNEWFQEENFFKIISPQKTKNSSLASCLDLRSDEKYGRYVVSSRQLSVGEVIAIEKPFCSVIISESRFQKVPEFNIYQRCNSCLRDNQLDLIPCPFCCEAMFCSRQCYEFASKYFHQYECPMMSEILKSASVNMALRIFFFGLSLFDNCINKLKDFYANYRNSMANIFDMDLSDENSLDYHKNIFTSVFCLSKSLTKFSLIRHEEILSSHPLLGDLWAENKDFISEFLQCICQISDHNFHGMFSGSLNSLEESNANSLQQPIGSSSLPFCSLMNHSCSPNVMRICFDGKVAVTVCRTIKKGAQIFDCYKANFMMEDKNSRQLRLSREFGFDCDCEACSNNWPIAKHLPPKDVKLLKFVKQINEELLPTMNRSQLMKKNRKLCDTLNREYENYPSVELCMLQKNIATIFLKLACPNFLF